MFKFSCGIVACALACAPLLGCASQTDPALKEKPLYGAGYNDGCATASARTGDATPGRVFRDKDAFDRDEAYRKGWGAGYRACNTRDMGGGIDGRL